MIGIPALLWLQEGAIIEKKEINILVRFWLGLLTTTWCRHKINQYFNMPRCY